MFPYRFCLIQPTKQLSVVGTSNGTSRRFAIGRDDSSTTPENGHHNPVDQASTTCTRFCRTLMVFSNRRLVSGKWFGAIDPVLITSHEQTVEFVWISVHYFQVLHHAFNTIPLYVKARNLSYPFFSDLTYAQLIMSNLRNTAFAMFFSFTDVIGQPHCKSSSNDPLPRLNSATQQRTVAFNEAESCIL